MGCSWTRRPAQVLLEVGSLEQTTFLTQLNTVTSQAAQGSIVAHTASFALVLIKIVVEPVTRLTIHVVSLLAH